ncbi:hypothetical protein ACX9NE_16780 [Mycobacterium sp. ML4]
MAAPLRSPAEICPVHQICICRAHDVGDEDHQPEYERMESVGRQLDRQRGCEYRQENDCCGALAEVQRGY